MVAFVQSPPPFRDLLLFVPKTEQGRRLAAAAPIDHDLTAADDRGDHPCLFFSGMAMFNGDILDSAEAVGRRMLAGKITLSDLLTGHGFYTAVVRAGERVFLLNDRTGYAMLFVLETEDLIVVSNRFHGLVATMRALDIPREPDYAAIASALLTTDSAFENAISERTPIRGVRLVRLDDYLEITGGRLSVHRNAAIEAVFAGEPLSRRAFRTELADGVDEVLAHIRAISDSGRFTHKRIGLTGGRDSRVIYGAVLRAGLIDQYDMDTYAPASESTTIDHAISLRLTSVFGGRYWSSDIRPRFAIQGHTAVAALISFQAGENRAIAINSSPSLGEANYSLKLIGAGGEYFRALYWTQHGYDKLYDSADPAGFFDKIFCTKVATEAMPADVRDDAIANYRATLAGLPCDDPRMKPDNFFAYYKNRCHFGHRNLTSFLEGIWWSPLDSLHLIRAMRSLSFEEFAESAGPAELMFEMAPALAFVDFNGSFLPDHVLRRNPLYHLKDFLVDAFGRTDVEARRAEWQQGRESLTAGYHAQLSAMKLWGWNALVQELRRHAVACLEEMRESDPVLRHLFQADGYATLAEDAAANNGRWMLLAAKVVEVHDACFDRTRYGFGMAMREDGEGRCEDALSLLTKMRG